MIRGAGCGNPARPDLQGGRGVIASVYPTNSLPPKLSLVAAASVPQRLRHAGPAAQLSERHFAFHRSTVEVAVLCDSTFYQASRATSRVRAEFTCVARLLRRPPFPNVRIVRMAAVLVYSLYLRGK